MNNRPRNGFVKNEYRFERPGHAYLRSIGPGRKACECGQEMTREQWTIHLAIARREPMDRPEQITSERQEIKASIRERQKLGLAVDGLKRDLKHVPGLQRKAEAA